MKSLPWRQIGSFWAQCARLLYWAFFKPFTYTDYLRAIHPDLQPTTNPDWLAAASPDNAALAEFRRQAAATVAVAPLLIIGVVGLGINLAGFTFDWPVAIVITMGFAAGSLLRNRLGPSDDIILRERQLWIGVGIFLLAYLLSLRRGLALDWLTATAVDQLGLPTAAALLPVLRPVLAAVMRLGLLFVEGVALGMALGVAIGVTLSVALGMAASGAGGGAVDGALGVAGGVASGAVLGVALSVAMGVGAGLGAAAVVGVAVSLMGNAAGGLAVGVGIAAGALRLVFWPFEVLWLLLLRFLAGASGAGGALHWLPTYYDEFIVLPLPLLGRFLAAAYRTNQAGARQAIDYLTTHSHQQAAARYAQRAIAIDAMRRCAHTDDIAHIADELGWIAPAAAQQADARLSGLLDVSRNVRAANVASTAFRRRAALQAQLDELDATRQGLTAAPAALAAQYGGVVDGWIAILTAAVHTLEQQTAGVEIPAVYIAGPHLRPETAAPTFVGRHDLIQEIERVIADQRPNILVLHGQRRTGKTSLIAFLPVRLPAHWLPLRVNVQAIAAAETAAGLAYQMAAEIVESARRARQVELRLPERKEFRDEPFLALADWLRRIERSAPKQQRFLLCFDEFQRLEETFAALHSRTLLDILRTLYEHRSRWAFLFVSSSTAAEMAPYWSDYLINARRLHISYLQPAEARQLIEHPTPDFAQHMTYTPEAVAAIVELTHGQPFLVQLLGSELVDLLNQEAGPDRQPRRIVTPGDVEAAIPRAFQHGGYYFEELWASLDGEQRSILRAVAQPAALDSPPPQPLAVLIRRELLAANNGGYSVQVPLIARWVREHANFL
jgi:AAA+ ATPase superfamily predicted ATPase